QALEAAMQQGSAESFALAMLVHPRKLVPQLPSVTATEESAALIRNGRAVNLPEMSRAPQVKVFYGQRDLIAIATRIAGTLFHPTIGFAGIAGEEGGEGVVVAAGQKVGPALRVKR